MPSTQTTPVVVFKLRVFWIDDPMMMAILRTDFSDVRTVRANVRIVSVGNLVGASSRLCNIFSLANILIFQVLLVSYTKPPLLRLPSLQKTRAV